MDLIGAIGGLALNCLAQACCWYTIFRQCGCIDGERETIQTEPPRIVVIKQNDNPFLNQQQYAAYPT